MQICGVGSTLLVNSLSSSHSRSHTEPPSIEWQLEWPPWSSGRRGHSLYLPVVDTQNVNTQQAHSLHGSHEQAAVHQQQTKPCITHFYRCSHHLLVQRCPCSNTGTGLNRCDTTGHMDWAGTCIHQHLNKRRDHLTLVNLSHENNYNNMIGPNNSQGDASEYA